jgi:hypothetical protein
MLNRISKSEFKTAVLISVEFWFDGRETIGCRPLGRFSTSHQPMANFSNFNEKRLLAVWSSSDPVPELATSVAFLFEFWRSQTGFLIGIFPPSLHVREDLRREYATTRINIRGNLSGLDR